MSLFIRPGHGCPKSYKVVETRLLCVIFLEACVWNRTLRPICFRSFSSLSRMQRRFFFVIVLLTKWSANDAVRYEWHQEQRCLIQKNKTIKERPNDAEKQKEKESEEKRAERSDVQQIQLLFCVQTAKQQTEKWSNVCHVICHSQEPSRHLWIIDMKSCAAAFTSLKKQSGFEDDVCWEEYFSGFVLVLISVLDVIGVGFYLILAGKVTQIICFKVTDFHIFFVWTKKQNKRPNHLSSLLF